jgi:arylformamidase
MTTTEHPLERQYNARLSIPEHPLIFAHWAARSRDTRATLPCVLDVDYADSAVKTIGSTLDVFPGEGPSRALLMHIHGGYWRSLDKSDFSYLAEAFRPAGVTLAVVNYDLAPKVSISHIVGQMLQASAWLYRNAGAFGADPNRMFVSGHSAGGHLAAMMLAAQWHRYGADLPAKLFQGGLAISGIYDLMPLLEVTVNNDLKLDRAEAHKVSPAYLPPATDAPLMTAVGGLESEEFKRQNALIASRWSSVFAGDIAMPGFNHLTVAEELGNKASPLYAGALKLMGLD